MCSFSMQIRPPRSQLDLMQDALVTEQHKQERQDKKRASLMLHKLRHNLIDAEERLLLDNIASGNSQRHRTFSRSKTLNDPWSLPESSRVSFAFIAICLHQAG